VVDETYRVLPWFVVRVVCSVLFLFFLILVMEDVVWSSVLLPTLVFYYLACTAWWRQRHIQKIYIDQNSSTCGMLLY
jgi:hypothetical protein